jgi:hypothetical protein
VPAPPEPYQSSSNQINPDPAEESFNPEDLYPKRDEDKNLEFSSIPPPERTSPSGTAQAPKKTESIFDKPPTHSVPENRHELPKIKLPHKKRLRPYKKIVAVLLLGVVGVSSLYYGYQLYSDKTKTDQVLGVSAGASLQDNVKRVSELVELSSADEQPTEVATIDDVKKLSDNAFFDRAANGDMILIYQTSKIAVLYRPSTGKVIAIGPVDSGEAPTPTPTAAPAEDEILSPTPSISPTKAPAQAVSSGSAQTE